MAAVYLQLYLTTCKLLSFLTRDREMNNIFSGFRLFNCIRHIPLVVSKAASGSSFPYSIILSVEVIKFSTSANFWTP